MVKELIGTAAAENGIDLLEYETMIDHVHVLLRAADRAGLSRAMNYLKGSTSRRLFQQVPELKLDIGMNNFWQHRYGFKVVPEGARATVGHYIRTQKERLEKYER
jgi:putative transposase